MIRVVGRQVVRLVTSVAIRRKTRVVVVDMAARARDLGVESRQREARLVVIKARLRPVGSVVAYLACSRIVHLQVRGSVRTLIVLKVARHTCRVDFRVLPVRVAGLALQRGVRAGECESSLGVIEYSIRP